jgi:ferrous iron transport protein A
VTLADIAPDSRCRVVGAALENRDFQSRLYALGLYPGVFVDVLHVAPMGDPYQVRIGRTLISIRKQEARLITVERAEVNTVEVDSDELEADDRSE